MKALINILITLLALAYSNISVAQDTMLISVGLFNNPQADKKGAEISALLPVATDLFRHEIQFAGVLYQANSDFAKKDLYGGFSAAWHTGTYTALAPFAGLGVYIGDTYNCEDNDLDCEESVIAAIYPEIGVKFRTQDFILSTFARRYIDSGDTPVSNAYGLSFGVRF